MQIIKLVVTNTTCGTKQCHFHDKELNKKYSKSIKMNKIEAIHTHRDLSCVSLNNRKTNSAAEKRLPSPSVKEDKAIILHILTN